MKQIDTLPGGFEYLGVSASDVLRKAVDANTFATQMARGIIDEAMRLASLGRFEMSIPWSGLKGGFTAELLGILQAHDFTAEVDNDIDFPGKCELVVKWKDAHGQG